MPLKYAVTLLVTVVIFTGAVRLAAPAKLPVSEVPLTSSQKSEIEGLIDRYLYENPHVIVKAIQNLQRQEDKKRHRQAGVPNPRLAAEHVRIADDQGLHLGLL